MNEIVMEPDCSEPNEQHDAYRQAGYPYPMGPVIPRPDASLPPLWPGLKRAGLSRPKAAAEVLINVYRHGADAGANWKASKEPLTARIDQTSRNLWQRVHTQSNTGVLSTAQIALRVLDGWVAAVMVPNLRLQLRSLVQEKLHPDLLNLHHAGRNNARSQSLLFAPPHYPTVGRQPPAVSGSLSWTVRYGEKTRRHVQELLLEEPAGEWNLLTLLFVKLLHTHMAWLAPAQIREERRAQYYRPLLRQLRLCAEQAGTPQAHPLADTAAGIWQNLRRVNLLLSTDKKNDRSFPLHTDALDPTHDLLPDSLHMGSALWVTECVSEVKQILRWMDDQGGGSEWTALEPWVDEVAALAWEMASARTDPFAMGGLGMVSDNVFKTTQIIKRFTEDWLAHVKGIRARVYQLHGATLTNKQATSLSQLPSRFKSAFVPDEAPSSEEPNARIDHTIRAIELWAERPAQLRLFYETTSKMLVSYGLMHFQTQQGTST